MPIPRTKHEEYLKENIADVDIRLSDDDLERLDGVTPVGIAASDHYPDLTKVNR